MTVVFLVWQGAWGSWSQTKVHKPQIASIDTLVSEPLTPLSSYRGFAKGWFPKGWFWRMFPRNENRNEGTFAKTTLLETALLSPNDPFGCWPKGGFQKGGFGGCSPGTNTETRVRSPKPPFYKTALLSPSDPRGRHPVEFLERVGFESFSVACFWGKSLWP